MTDHSVNDLSYGHLGKAFYDPEECQWIFTKAIDQGAITRQITPFTKCIGPDIQDAPAEADTPLVVARRQSIAALRAGPETYPGIKLISTFARASAARALEPSHRAGTLLDIGHAFDAGRVSRTRKPRIFAVVSGSAGHILHLTRPQRQTRSWGKNSAARLSMFDSSVLLDHGYWTGIGGPIRQIIFSKDEEPGSDTWLAVRQAAVITIFRPLYGNLRGASRAGHSPDDYPPSLLDPNPIASVKLPGDATSDQSDVSFNPWYSQQFAIVDSQGRWAVHEIIKPHDKVSTFKLTLSRRGKFHEGVFGTNGPAEIVGGLSDGWFKILWVCDINTLILCNRRQIAVNDIKGLPVRLGYLELFSKNSAEWILDIMLHPSDSSQVFILTTARVFWFQISPAGEIIEYENSQAGIRVLLSFRHFRDPGDETMKLTLVNDEHISILVTSATSPHVNTYNFWIDTGKPCCEQNSFNLNFAGIETHMQTVRMIPCRLFAAGIGHRARPESQYLEKGLQFYQLWILTTGLGLSSALCVVKRQESENTTSGLRNVQPPTNAILKRPRHLERHATEASFIVLNGLENGEPTTHHPDHALVNAPKASTRRVLKNDLRLRVNWRMIYQTVYRRGGLQNAQQQALPAIIDIFTHISEVIRRGLEINHLPLYTILEMSGWSGISDDLEKAAPLFQEYLGSLSHDQDPECSSIVTVSDITTSSLFGTLIDETSSRVQLLRIYGRLVDTWMASLPPSVSNRSRAHKFTIIRQLALDLCFSSFGLYIHNKLANPLDDPEEPKAANGGEDVAATTRESSPAFFSSQLAAINEQSSDFRPLTPAQTSSLYSQATSGSEMKEDQAIARLRQYVPSITAKLDLEQPSLLSHWPSAPGSDPALYSYDSAQKASADSGDEQSFRSRREEARRRKRTEKFLRQERSRAVESASQAAATPAGSQPEYPHHAFSSQVVEDVPMTQPVGGLFGSRSVPASKKGKKRAAGFR